jgi:hypothetical protein
MRPAVSEATLSRLATALASTAPDPVGPAAKRAPMARGAGTAKDDEHVADDRPANDVAAPAAAGATALEGPRAVAPAVRGRSKPGAAGG